MRTADSRLSQAGRIRVILFVLSICPVVVRKTGGLQLPEGTISGTCSTTFIWFCFVSRFI